MREDDLNVENENKVLAMVENYIRHREDKQPDKTEEEKKAEKEAREKAVAEGQEVPPDAEEEEKKKKEFRFCLRSRVREIVCRLRSTEKSCSRRMSKSTS